MSAILPLRSNSDAESHLAAFDRLIAARGATGSVLTGAVSTVVNRLRTGARPRLVVLDLPDGADPRIDVPTVRAAAGSDLPLLVVGPVNDVHFFRDLIQAGATDYLPLPASDEAVQATLDRLLAAPSGGSTSQGGRVAVVLGTRGGVGATTVAITLAWLVSEEMKKRTALLDLDLHFGTTALALDIDPGRGLRDALEKPERIDGLFIDRALAKVGTNLFTLAAEEPVEEGSSFDPEAAGTLLAELRQKFDWTVIDLPRGAGQLARTVLAAATDTIIVADSTLAGLRDTIRLQTLARMANPDQRVLVLKGGALGEHGGVARGAFEKELGRPFDAAIPSDAKGAFAAANAGQPLPVAARNSPIVPAIRRLAATIAGVEPERKGKLGLRFGRL